ncbi:MAG: hypothetical protein ACPLRA_03485, partial [Candidatus Saccharicenans sp.]
MSAFVLLFFLLTTPVQEKLQAPLSLTIGQAVEIAFQKNPNIQALAQEIESFRAQTRIESALPEAEIGLEVAGLNFPGVNRDAEKE